MISATGSGKSGTPRKGSRFSCPLQGEREEDPGGKQATGAAERRETGGGTSGRGKSPAERLRGKTGRRARQRRRNSPAIRELFPL